MRDRYGLTLTELLVAIAVIGIAFTALALSQISGFRVTTMSAEQAIARDIATREMATLRARGYAEFKGCAASSSVHCGGDTSSRTFTDADNPNFQYTWQVTTNPNDPTAMGLDPLPYVYATVRVTWPSGEYQLASFLSCADAGAESSTNVQCPEETMIPTP